MLRDRLMMALTSVKSSLGTLWAWGSNASGSVGDNTAVDKSSPTNVGTLSTWSAISAGGTHSLALKGGSTLWAWGYNKSGQLGDGTTVNRSSPAQIGRPDVTWAS